MDITAFTNTPSFEWVILPLLIVLARVIDVTIGTLRIIFVSKGMKYLAPIMGFFEVIIWLLAIGQIMQNLSNFINYIAYGLGFAIGNYIGIYLDGKLSLGFVLVRVITRRSAHDLKNYFKNSNLKYTIVDATSDQEPVNIIFLPIKRRKVDRLIRDVKKYNPKAFYTIEDIRHICEDVNLPSSTKPSFFSRRRLIPRWKKK